MANSQETTEQVSFRLLISSIWGMFLTNVSDHAHFLMLSKEVVYYNEKHHQNYG